MKVQLVTPYRVTHLQRYGVTVRGNVTSVYPPQDCPDRVLGSSQRPLFDNTQHSQVNSMLSAGFEPAILASER